MLFLPSAKVGSPLVLCAPPRRPLAAAWPTRPQPTRLRAHFRTAARASCGVSLLLVTFQGCPVALFVPNQRNVSEQSFSYPSKTVGKGGTLVRLPDPSQAPSGQTSDLEGALLRPCLCCTFGFQSLRACEQLNFSTSTKRPSHPAYLSLLAFVTTISPTAQEFWLLVNAQAIVFPCQGLQFAKGKESPQSQPLHNHSAPWLCLPPNHSSSKIPCFSAPLP